MTSDQFRANQAMTSRMRVLLNDPVMLQAMVIMRDGMPPVDAPVASPDVVSTRILSQMAGAYSAFMLLQSLADPMEPEPEENPPDWGTQPEPETP